MTDAHSPIVVAVGDSTDEDAALRFAAEEAKRSDHSIRVVHVAHGFATVTPHNFLVSYATAGDIGQQLVTQAAEQLRKLTGDQVEISTLVARGSAVEQLVALSRDAYLMVISHRDVSGLHRVFTGSVGSRVAGRAAVDTVSVPELWAPSSAFISRVGVGVGTWHGAGRLLERAFAVADQHGANVRLLHTLELPSVYEGALANAEESFNRWRDTTTQLIEAELTEVLRRHPSVDSTVELEVARPADALVEASRDVDLLVVGRRDTAHAAVEHLGSVTHALLRTSHCPVDVVPRPLG